MAAKQLDGMNASDYAESFNWDPTRWAWEFLSRNQEYRSICEELDRESDPQEARQVAKAFGLKKYKSVFDPYDMPSSPSPCFLPNTVYAQARLGRKDSNVYKRQLNVGDIVILFSLLDAMTNPAALDAKLRAIEKVAKQNIAKLQVKTKTKSTAIRIGHDKDWITLLRLLDALSTKIAPVQIAKLIFPTVCQRKDGTPKSDAQLRDLIKERKKRAQELANRRYLFIAAWPGKSAVCGRKPAA
jgi:hypothetical protein